MVGLNRPEKRNAMPKSMMFELREIFSNIPDDVGAAVLYSTSEHFCSGLDLTQVKDQSVIDCFQFFRQWQETFRLIQFGHIPVVAALSGAAIGAGLEMASACHIRVMDESAYFQLPEAARGLYVGLGASVRFPRLAGTALMMDMMLTGRPLPAHECFARGGSVDDRRRTQRNRRRGAPAAPCRCTGWRLVEWRSRFVGDAGACDRTVRRVAKCVSLVVRRRARRFPRHSAPPQIMC